jgi:membrane protein DedA with SNARE-associated domain
MHISAHTVNDLLASWGYLAVFVFVAVESTGVPFPGETMLVAAAVYAGTGHLQIALVIAAAAAGAIGGDNLGYLIGRTGGRGIAMRFGKYVGVDASRLQIAEDFFARHGDKTVFLGRFVALLRTWAAFLAGLNRMPWPRFLAFNAAGGICWAVLYGVLAFELGKNLPLLHRILGAFGIGGVILAVVVVGVLLFLHWRHRRARPRPSDDVEEKRRASS